MTDLLTPPVDLYAGLSPTTSRPAVRAYILGIRPDRVVEIRHDILAEIDGPMLRHGLQEMHGAQILLPRSRRDHPDPVRLEERYTAFRIAA